MGENIVFTNICYYRGKGNTILFNDDHIYKLEFQTICMCSENQTFYCK